MLLALPVWGQTMNLGHQFASGSLPDRVARRFAEQVAEDSGGRIRITVKADARFGDERENVLLLRRGRLDFSVVGDLIVGELEPAYRVINMPFIYRDAAHAMEVYNGPLGQEVRDSMARIGLHPLSWHYTGTRMLTANRPLRNLSDLEGLVLRLPPDRAFTATWRRLGADVRHVPFSELGTALRLGTIAAQENPPNFIRAGKFYEHQRYIIMTAHLPQRQFLLASGKVWNALPAERRKLIAQAARKVSEWATEVAQTENRADLKWLLSEGNMEQVAFDPAGIARMLDEVPAQLAGEGGQAVYRRILGTH